MAKGEAMKKRVQKVKTNLLSLDIGSDSIKIATGQFNGDKLKISNLIKVPVHQGVIQNGRIVDDTAFKNLLLSTLKEAKIKQKEVVVTCECQDIIKRELSVQKVDEADQMELITYEVGQYLPIDIDAYVLQYKILNEFEENEVQKVRVLLGAMPKDIVKSIFDLLVDCGLSPRYLDMHSNSLDKFINLSFDSITLSKTLAFIDFGHDLIDITLFEKGEFKFNRLLKLGLSEFDRILQDHFGIDAIEAEQRKKKTSITALVGAVEKEGFNPNDDKGILLSETASYFNECGNEIEKVFKYYTSRSGDNKIDNIYIYGGGASAKDMVNFFKDRFETPTEIISHLGMIELNTKNAVSEMPIFINAVGSLIRK